MDITNDLNSIIKAYNDLVKGIEDKAKIATDRAYGGIIRAGKGKLVENIGKSLIEIAWRSLNKKQENLKFKRKIIYIPIKKDYISKMKNHEIKKYIEDNIKDFKYPLTPDIQVFINDTFKMVVECKAYTENAMLKRILVDFTLLKSLYPNLIFVLLQLESQLGGDYSYGIEAKFGSPSTHTLLSYFDIDLNIVTLLKGERKVDKPIHKYYKPLELDTLIKVIEIFQKLLER